ncbi:hypothetical protein BKA70DRAFT_1435335 [Coprinopsis sp. MPI-PUGE-AT-0042]|nr:hypothetical protein BKA70DRAFT_1435335 [Coprinopsis sp. MPI-PUGE-AT-0042]
MSLRRNLFKWICLLHLLTHLLTVFRVLGAQHCNIAPGIDTSVTRKSWSFTVKLPGVLSKSPGHFPAVEFAYGPSASCDGSGIDPWHGFASASMTLKMARRDLVGLETIFMVEIQVLTVTFPHRTVVNLTRLYRDASLESDYPHLHPQVEDPTTQYEILCQAFEDQEHQPDPDSDTFSDDEGSPPVGSYFEGFCGALFGDSPQLQADFNTHSFQRQLNDERRAIQEHRLYAARVLEFYHNRPGGWGVRWDDLDRAGITDEDINVFYARNLRFS